jgi:hypothetical protein
MFRIPADALRTEDAPAAAGLARVRRRRARRGGRASNRPSRRLNCRWRRIAELGPRAAPGTAAPSAAGRREPEPLDVPATAELPQLRRPCRPCCRKPPTSRARRARCAGHPPGLHADRVGRSDRGDAKWRAGRPRPGAVRDGAGATMPGPTCCRSDDFGATQVIRAEPVLPVELPRGRPGQRLRLRPAEELAAPEPEAPHRDQRHRFRQPGRHRPAPPQAHDACRRRRRAPARDEQVKVIGGPAHRHPALQRLPQRGGRVVAPPGHRDQRVGAGDEPARARLHRGPGPTRWPAAPPPWASRPCPRSPAASKARCSTPRRWPAARPSTPTFTEAAEEVRRLLHQFAAGFLKDPTAVVQALHELEGRSKASRARIGGANCR